MAYAPLVLVPTVDVEKTETLNQAGISACNLIRFKAKLPQKLGGWERYYPFALSGVPRALMAWQDLTGDGRLAVGTTTQLGVIHEGTLSDITPQSKTTNPNEDFSTTNGSPTVTIVDSGISNVTTYDAIFFGTPIAVGGLILQGLYSIDSIVSSTSYRITATSNATSTVTNGGAVPAFATTSGSAIVTVTLTAHGLSVGDYFVFPISTTVGGVTISGATRVASVPTANTFTIAAPSLATSTTSASMNGGNARLVYYIAIGPNSVGAGYGMGGYGLGGYGTGVSPGAQTGTPITATNWTLDNWGEIAIASPRDGAIYQWQPNVGLLNAQVIPTAPAFNTGIFISMPQQILVAYGSTAGTPGTSSSQAAQQDSLMLRWCDQEDFTTWIASSSNQAGSFRIPTGSKIVGAMQAAQQGLIWTDIDLWVMNYIGSPLVFSFNKVGTGCGLIGQHAAALLRGVAFWMGSGNFYSFGNNGVAPIPCTVWDAVFQDLHTTHAHKCVAAANAEFDEVSFFYPSLSGGTGEIDKYVKFNPVEGSWDYGSLDRTAWIDQSVLGKPIGATSAGIVFQHETDANADGQAMNSWFETGWFVIAEAQNQVFVDWFFPDMKFGLFEGSDGASVQVTIYAVDYPNGTERTYGPFTINAAKTFVNTRLRGRQIKLRFESSDLDSFWRLGLMRYRLNQDGRR